MNKQPERLISLDVFRGITIMGMILVNNPGSWSHVYSPLRHAPWHGWTPTDFIFPFFLFIVGVAMAYALSRRIEQGVLPAKLLGKVVRRTLILFGIGLLLNLIPFFRFSDMRIMGVLQRIALCYLFSAIMILYLKPKIQIGVTIFILAIYWVLLKVVPVPGFGTGLLEPEGNLCWWVDSHVLAGHTWKGAPVSGFDPEGLLSTLPAVVTTMLGAFTGAWLRSDKERLEKVAGLFVFGVLGLVGGAVLSIWMPINKNLWTSSYVIFMGGMALIFLAMCFYFTDIRGWKGWAKPFIVFGSNAIIVFSLSSLTAKILSILQVTSSEGVSVSLKQWLYTHLYASWAGALNGSLLYAVVYILIWLGLMWILYRKRVFIKI